MLIDLFLILTHAMVDGRLQQALSTLVPPLFKYAFLLFVNFPVTHRLMSVLNCHSSENLTSFHDL